MQVSCQLHALAALPIRKEVLLPIEQVASWVERFGEMVNVLSFPEIEPRILSCPARTLVTIPTELGQWVEVKTALCSAVEASRRK